MKINQLFFNTGLTLVMLISTMTFSHAQSEKTDVIGQKVAVSRGTQKYERPTKDVVAKKEKTRGEACCIGFDNLTGYFLDIWVDDTYRGRVSPYGDNALCVPSGFTTWYVETAGSTYYWSGSGNCDSNFNILLED